MGRYTRQQSELTGLFGIGVYRLRLQLQADRLEIVAGSAGGDRLKKPRRRDRWPRAVRSPKGNAPFGGGRMHAVFMSAWVTPDPITLVALVLKPTIDAIFS